MPLDPYLTSAKDIQEIVTARAVGATACMRGLGFRKWPLDLSDPSMPGDDGETDVFEYLDPAVAAKEGYPTPSATVTPEISRHVPTRDELGAFSGKASKTKAGVAVPPGGCERQGDLKVFAGQPRLPADPRSLAVDSRSQAMTDSRVRKAIAGWKECVGGKGLAYDSPVVPAHDLRWVNRTAGTAAGEEEKRVAAIDATCRNEVNLVGVYKTVRAAYENILLTKNKAELDAAAPIFAQWLANARAVIKAGY
ncbi:hypothetical protein AB0K48_41695 [Nonomuraea sp. NPDC055795]